MVTASCQPTQRQKCPEVEFPLAAGRPERTGELANEQTAVAICSFSLSFSLSLQQLQFGLLDIEPPNLSRLNKHTTPVGWPARTHGAGSSALPNPSMNRRGLSTSAARSARPPPARRQCSSGRPRERRGRPATRELCPRARPLASEPGSSSASARTHLLFCSSSRLCERKPIGLATNYKRT